MMQYFPKRSIDASVSTLLHGRANAIILCIVESTRTAVEVFECDVMRSSCFHSAIACTPSKLLASNHLWLMWYFSFLHRSVVSHCLARFAAHINHCIFCASFFNHATLWIGLESTCSWGASTSLASLKQPFCLLPIWLWIGPAELLSLFMAMIIWRQIFGGINSFSLQQEGCKHLGTMQHINIMCMCRPGVTRSEGQAILLFNFQVNAFGSHLRFLHALFGDWGSLLIFSFPDYRIIGRLVLVITRSECSVSWYAI